MLSWSPLVRNRSLVLRGHRDRRGSVVVTTAVDVESEPLASVTSPSLPSLPGGRGLMIQDEWIHHPCTPSLPASVLGLLAYRLQFWALGFFRMV